MLDIKQKKIIEELPKEVLASIEDIENAKMQLQLTILERLVKYTGKDINSITDKRSTKAIDKIVNEIKQEFFDSIPQEPVVIETKDIPDSDVVNMNILTIEGIKQEVEQNTVSLVEKTEKNT